MYYICNGVKNKTGCHKKTVQKQFIEDLVIDHCRKLLTDDNIDRIVKSVYAAVEKQPKNSELEAFKKELKDVEKKRTNLLNAVMECDIDVVRKSLYKQLEAIEQRYSDIEYNISVEEHKAKSITPEMIAFFLYELKKGNADDIVYRRALISTFINKIFLYDDKLIIHFNTDGEPIEITADIMEEIEKSNAKAEYYFGSGSSGARRRPCQTRNAQSFRVQVKTVRWTDLRESVGATIDRRCRSQGEAAIFLHLPHTDGPPETP